MPFGMISPNSASRPRIWLACAVRDFTKPCRARCSANTACCSTFLMSLSYCTFHSRVLTMTPDRLAISCTRKLLGPREHRRWDPVTPTNPSDHRVVECLALSACDSVLVELTSDLGIAHIEGKMLDESHRGFRATYAISKGQRY